MAVVVHWSASPAYLPIIAKLVRQQSCPTRTDNRSYLSPIRQMIHVNYVQAITTWQWCCPICGGTRVESALVDKCEGDSPRLGIVRRFRFIEIVAHNLQTAANAPLHFLPAPLLLAIHPIVVHKFFTECVLQEIPVFTTTNDKQGRP
jgi:hypothetical protein